MTTTSTKIQPTIVITGGTTGLGYGAALALARHFPTHTIILASRSNKDAAHTRINNKLHQKNTTYLPLDLSSLDSIRSFTTNLLTSHPSTQITHLLLNAGLQFPGPISYTPPPLSLEKTFMINHLGHAYLFYLLLPHLSPSAHITITASGTHDPAQKTGLPVLLYTDYASVARPDALTANKDGRERYSTSKLLNVMWTYALARHIRQLPITSPHAGIVVNAFDPGLMPGTGLARHYPAPIRLIWNWILPHALWLAKIVMNQPNTHTTSESGGELAKLAIGEDEGWSGRGGHMGFEPKGGKGWGQVRSSEGSYDEGKGEDLWWGSVRELGKATGEEGAEKLWGNLEA